VADAIDANLVKMQDSAAELAVELLQAQGDMAGAASAQRALDTAGYSDLAVAQYDANESTRALITTTLSAANAAETLASAFSGSMSSIASARQSLQVQLLTARGDIAGATALDRSMQIATAIPEGSTAEQVAAITDALNANFALEDQIRLTNEATQAAAAANAAAASAAEQAASAARQLKDAWKSLTNSLMDEIRRIRGEMLGGPASQAMLQAQFATATAQARAGDQTAAGQLSGLANALLAAGLDNSATALDYARLQGQTAASLQYTLNTVADKFGIALPADMRVETAAPTRLTTPGGRTRGDRDDALVAEIRALREELKGLRAESQATARNTYQTQKLLDRAMPDGDALATRTAT
jgi:hypothetical protein